MNREQRGAVVVRIAAALVLFAAGNVTAQQPAAPRASQPTNAPEVAAATIGPNPGSQAERRFPDYWRPLPSEGGEMWSPLRWRIGPPLSSSGVASAVITPVPARAPYSVPYGPHFSRPSGRVIVPFGSSQYYYHR